MILHISPSWLKKKINLLLKTPLRRGSFYGLQSESITHHFLDGSVFLTGGKAKLSEDDVEPLLLSTLLTGAIFSLD